MIQIHDLSFAYPNESIIRFPDITLQDRQHLLILGESGIGKTTLLHLIAGLLRPASGQILIQRQNINRFSERDLDHFRGQHVGLVFQHPHFIHALSLLENLLMIQYLAGKEQSTRHVEKILRELGLEGKTKKKPENLSQGEKQRAAIAAALINHPSLILADEPTSSLDDHNCETVAKLLQHQAQETGAHLMVITHDQRLKEYFNETLTL